VAQILTRYRNEVSPKMRNHLSEIARINAILRRPCCQRTLALLPSSDLATYRDERLKLVAPATVIRELNTISHAIDTARREWGVHLAQNPCKLVRRPSPLRPSSFCRLASRSRMRNPKRPPYAPLAMPTQIVGRSERKWEQIHRNLRRRRPPQCRNSGSEPHSVLTPSS
jgi:hypothetical protein